MDSRTYLPDQSEDIRNLDPNDPESSDKKLLAILGEYKDLLEFQAEERNQLLNQVETLTEKTDDINHIDNKLESLVSLLADIKNQISALSNAVPSKIVPDELSKVASTIPSVEKYIPKSAVLASEDDINSLSDDILTEADNLENDVVSLQGLIDTKVEELKEKDLFIEGQNQKLQGVTDEKERLALQLESMNSVIGSWQGQLNLLQKLAASDPRYKVIGSLKKHGSLSDIQLAFTMGTSISQIRKYIEDLKELELVRKDSTGRYIWVGQGVEEELDY